jgi:hypothetical protein
MSNSINRTVTANDFSSGVIQHSNNRPIILLNGESAEVLGDLKAVVLRIVAEVDPSIDVVLMSNTEIERVQQQSLVSLFFPEGITVWWQGYTLGALQGTRDERVIRKAVMAASSRISHQTVSTLLQEAGTNQFQLFHRAVKPEIQSWVELFVLYRFDLDAAQHGIAGELGHQRGLGFIDLPLVASRAWGIPTFVFRSVGHGDQHGVVGQILGRQSQATNR